MKNVSASFGRQIARGAILAIIVSLLLIVGLHLAAVPVEVRGAGARRPRARRAHHDRHLRAPRPGGDDRHGRRGAHRARVLDLRHDHHLRPHPREHPADEARAVPGASGTSRSGRRSRARWRRRSSRSCRSSRSGCSAATRSRTSRSRCSSGIGAGAYSSIFIAAPLLAMFKEREPEYARRRDDEAAVDVSVGGALLETPRRRGARRRGDRGSRAGPGCAGGGARHGVELGGSRAQAQRRSGRRPHGRAR